MSKKIYVVMLVLLMIVLAGCCDNKYCNNVAENKAENNTSSEQKNDIPLPHNEKGRYEEDLGLKTNYKYNLEGSYEVDGRQGIAYFNGEYLVSGSTSLSRYDKDWKLVSSSNNTFAGFENEVNHIGDIDVYNNEIYAGVEYFMDGEAKIIQVAIYDIDSFELKRTYTFDSSSGQNEVSGIAVDPDSKSIWMCSWADSESGRYLYRYDLETGKYLGKYHLQAPPQWIQGIAYLDGYIYITADDGTADLGEADHIYRVKVNLENTSMPVLIERTLDDVILQGEIEGISFDKDNKKMFVSYNRGAQIVLGMPKGFYEGYNKEIHEIFVYSMEKR